MFCPQCGQAIAVPAIDLGTATARCARCRVSFAFSGRHGADTGRSMPSGGASMEDRARLPEGLVARREENFLILDRRWWRGQTVVMVGGGLWIAMVYGLLQTRLYEPRWFVIGFHTMLVGLTIPLGYALLALLLNRTTILVEPRSIRIRHHPLPWPGGRIYAAKGIVQLYCQCYGHEPAFRLQAITRAGQKVRLLGGLSEADALCLERLIESHLGIEQQVVAAELR